MSNLGTYLTDAWAIWFAAALVIGGALQARAEWRLRGQRKQASKR